MSADIDHPFKPGTRVAYKEYRDSQYVERFVDKVYKTGNFTLRDSSQQWRPSRSGYGDQARWNAFQAGRRDSWSRRMLVLWDAATDQEISEQVAKHKKRTRLRDVQRRLERVSAEDITEEALEAIERALLPKEDEQA